MPNTVHDLYLYSLCMDSPVWRTSSCLRTRFLCPVDLFVRHSWKNAQCNQSSLSLSWFMACCFFVTLSEHFLPFAMSHPRMSSRRMHCCFCNTQQPPELISLSSRTALQELPHTHMDVRRWSCLMADRTSYRDPLRAVHT